MHMQAEQERAVRQMKRNLDYVGQYLNKRPRYNNNRRGRGRGNGNSYKPYNNRVHSGYSNSSQHPFRGRGFGGGNRKSRFN